MMPVLLRLFRLGVRQKVILILLTTLLIAFSISGWLALQSHKEDLLKEIDRRGVELTRSAAETLAYDVVGYDYHTIELRLHDLIKRDDIVYARVLSNRGNTMGEAGVEPKTAGNRATFGQDIRMNGEVVGKLYLGFSTERLVTTLDKQRDSLIARELTIIVVIAMVEFIALSFFIVRPVTVFSKSIIQGINSTDGDERLIPIDSNDEFGDMARAFNKLRREPSCDVTSSAVLPSRGSRPRRPPPKPPRPAPLA